MAVRRRIIEGKECYQIGLKGKIYYGADAQKKALKEDLKPVRDPESVEILVEEVDENPKRKRN